MSEKIQLVSGGPVPADRSHTELKPNGQQRDYVVLSADEWESMRLTADQIDNGRDMSIAILQALIDAGYRRRVCKRCGELQTEFKKCIA